MGGTSRFNIHSKTDAERWHAVPDALENLRSTGNDSSTTDLAAHPLIGGPFFKHDTDHRREPNLLCRVRCHSHRTMQRPAHVRSVGEMQHHGGAFSAGNGGRVQAQIEKPSAIRSGVPITNRRTSATLTR